MKFSRPTLQSLCLFLSVLLFATNTVLAHAPENNFWKERLNHQQLVMSNPVIPAKVHPGGSVLWRTGIQSFPFLAPNSVAKNKVSSLKSQTLNSKPNIIHIQDVHLNSEAQVNIGSVIQQLIDNKKIDLIALEGAFEPIDLSSFRNYPYQDTVKKVADYLLKENKISGPIHTALTSKENPPFIVGVDDKDHYEKNVEAYRTSAPLQKKYKEDLALQDGELKKQKAASFNSDLKRFDEKVTAYREGEILLGKYLEFIVGAQHVAPKNQEASSIRAWAQPAAPLHIELFLEAYSLEKSLNFSQVESERAHLLNLLMTRLDRSETDYLMNLSLSFRAEQISSSEFYDSLRRLCESHHIELKKFPAMNSYIQYVLLSDNIKMEPLFKEMKQLEEDAFASLAVSAQEKRLVEESKYLFLVGKLLDFALTKEEWEEYKYFRRGEPLARPKSVVPFSAGNSAVRASQRLAPTESFERFYEEAEARDRLMSDNLQSAIKKYHAHNIVLVTGGFHSSGIETLTRAAGFTTIPFTPKLTHIDTDQGTAYLTFFTQQKTPLDKLFQGEKLFLNPIQMPNELKQMLGLMCLAWDWTKRGPTEFQNAIRSLGKTSMKIAGILKVKNGIQFVILTSKSILTKVLVPFQGDDFNGMPRIVESFGVGFGIWLLKHSQPQSMMTGSLLTKALGEIFVFISDHRQSFKKMFVEFRQANPGLLFALVAISFSVFLNGHVDVPICLGSLSQFAFIRRDPSQKITEIVRTRKALVDLVDAEKHDHGSRLENKSMTLAPRGPVGLYGTNGFYLSKEEFEFWWGMREKTRYRGYSANIIKSQIHYGRSEFTVKFWKGKETFYHTFQIGPDRTLSTSRRAGLKSQKKEIWKISDEAGLKTFLAVLQKPEGINWKDFVTNMKDVRGLFIGTTDPQGAIDLRPVPNFHYNFPILGKYESGWQVRVLDIVVGSNDVPQVTFELSQQGKKPIKKDFYLGPFQKSLISDAYHALKKSSKTKTIEPSKIWGLNENPGKALLAQLVQKPDSMSWSSYLSRLPSAEGLFIGELLNDGETNFTVQPNFPYSWEIFKRIKSFLYKKYGWKAFLSYVEQKGNFLVVYVELQKRAKTVLLPYYLGLSKRKLPGRTHLKLPKSLEVLRIDSTPGFSIIEALLTKNEEESWTDVFKKIGDVSDIALDPTNNKGGVKWNYLRLKSLKWSILGRYEAGWQPYFKELFIKGEIPHITIRLTKGNQTIFRIFKIETKGSHNSRKLVFVEEFDPEVVDHRLQVLLKKENGLNSSKKAVLRKQKRKIGFAFSKMSSGFFFSEVSTLILNRIAISDEGAYKNLLPFFIRLLRSKEADPKFPWVIAVCGEMTKMMAADKNKEDPVVSRWQEFLQREKVDIRNSLKNPELLEQELIGKVKALLTLLSFDKEDMPKAIRNFEILIALNTLTPQFKAAHPLLSLKIAYLVLPLYDFQGAFENYDKYIKDEVKSFIQKLPFVSIHGPIDTQLKQKLLAEPFNTNLPGKTPHSFLSGFIPIGFASPFIGVTPPDLLDQYGPLLTLVFGTGLFLFATFFMKKIKPKKEKGKAKERSGLRKKDSKPWSRRAFIKRVAQGVGLVSMGAGPVWRAWQVASKIPLYIYYGGHFSDHWQSATNFFDLALEESGAGVENSREAIVLIENVIHLMGDKVWLKRLGPTTPPTPLTGLSVDQLENALQIYRGNQDERKKMDGIREEIWQKEFGSMVELSVFMDSSRSANLLDKKFKEGFFGYLGAKGVHHLSIEKGNCEIDLLNSLFEKWSELANQSLEQGNVPEFFERQEKSLQYFYDLNNRRDKALNRQIKQLSWDPQTRGKKILHYRGFQHYYSHALITRGMQKIGGMKRDSLDWGNFSDIGVIRNLNPLEKKRFIFVNHMHDIFNIYLSAALGQEKSNQFFNDMTKELRGLKTEQALYEWVQRLGSELKAPIVFQGDQPNRKLLKIFMDRGYLDKASLEKVDKVIVEDIEYRDQNKNKILIPRADADQNLPLAASFALLPFVRASDLPDFISKLQPGRIMRSIQNKFSPIKASRPTENQRNTFRFNQNSGQGQFRGKSLFVGQNARDLSEHRGEISRVGRIDSFQTAGKQRSDFEQIPQRGGDDRKGSASVENSRMVPTPFLTVIKSKSGEAPEVINLPAVGQSFEVNGLSESEPNLDRHVSLAQRTSEGYLAIESSERLGLKHGPNYLHGPTRSVVQTPPTDLGNVVPTHDNAQTPNPKPGPSNWALVLGQGIYDFVFSSLVNIFEGGKHRLKTWENGINPHFWRQVSLTGFLNFPWFRNFPLVLIGVSNEPFYSMMYPTILDQYSPLLLLASGTILFLGSFIKKSRKSGKVKSKEKSVKRKKGPTDLSRRNFLKGLGVALVAAGAGQRLWQVASTLPLYIYYGLHGSHFGQDAKDFFDRAMNDSRGGQENSKGAIVLVETVAPFIGEKVWLVSHRKLSELTESTKMTLEELTEALQTYRKNPNEQKTMDKAREAIWQQKMGNVLEFSAYLKLTHLEELLSKKFQDEFHAYLQEKRIHQVTLEKGNYEIDLLILLSDRWASLANQSLDQRNISAFFKNHEKSMQFRHESVQARDKALGFQIKKLSSDPQHKGKKILSFRGYVHFLNHALITSGKGRIGGVKQDSTGGGKYNDFSLISNLAHLEKMRFIFMNHVYGTIYSYLYDALGPQRANQLFEDLGKDLRKIDTEQELNDWVGKYVSDLKASVSVQGNLLNQRTLRIFLDRGYLDQTSFEKVHKTILESIEFFKQEKKEIPIPLADLRENIPLAASFPLLLSDVMGLWRKPKDTRLKILIADKPAGGDETVGAIKKLAGQFDSVLVLDNVGIGKDEKGLRKLIKKEKPAVVIVRSDTTAFKNEKFIQFAKRHGLKALIRAGSGVDNIDTEAARKNEVAVIRTHGNANSVANLNLRFLLAALLNPSGKVHHGPDVAQDPVLGKIFDVSLADFNKAEERSVKGGRGSILTGQRNKIFPLLSVEELKDRLAILQGKTIGILGFGPTGQALAEKLKALKELTQVDFDVVAFSPSLLEGKKGRAIESQKLGVRAVTREELVKNSHIIAVHLAGSAAPLSAEELSQNKDLIAIINTARPKYVSPKILQNPNAVHSGGILNFVDAKVDEDLSSYRNNHPYHVFLTPHLAASTDNAAAGVDKHTLDTLQALIENFQGLPPSTDFQVDIVNGVPIHQVVTKQIPAEKKPLPPPPGHFREMTQPVPDRRGDVEASKSEEVQKPNPFAIERRTFFRALGAALSVLGLNPLSLISRRLVPVVPMPPGPDPLLLMLQRTLTDDGLAKLDSVAVLSASLDDMSGAMKSAESPEEGLIIGNYRACQFAESYISGKVTKVPSEDEFSDHLLDFFNPESQLLPIPTQVSESSYRHLFFPFALKESEFNNFRNLSHFLNRPATEMEKKTWLKIADQRERNLAVFSRHPAARSYLLSINAKDQELNRVYKLQKYPLDVRLKSLYDSLTARLRMTHEFFSHYKDLKQQYAHHPAPPYFVRLFERIVKEGGSFLKNDPEFLLQNKYWTLKYQTMKGVFQSETIESVERQIKILEKEIEDLRGPKEKIDLSNEVLADPAQFFQELIPEIKAVQASMNLARERVIKGQVDEGFLYLGRANQIRKGIEEKLSLAQKRSEEGAPIDLQRLKLLFDKVRNQCGLFGILVNWEWLQEKEDEGQRKFVAKFLKETDIPERIEVLLEIFEVTPGYIENSDLGPSFEIRQQRIDEKFAANMAKMTGETPSENKLPPLPPASALSTFNLILALSLIIVDPFHHFQFVFNLQRGGWILLAIIILAVVHEAGHWFKMPKGERKLKWSLFGIHVVGSAGRHGIISGLKLASAFFALGLIFPNPQNHFFTLALISFIITLSLGDLRNEFAKKTDPIKKFKKLFRKDIFLWVVYMNGTLQMIENDMHEDVFLNQKDRNEIEPFAKSTFNNTSRGSKLESLIYLVNDLAGGYKIIGRKILMDIVVFGDRPEDVEMLNYVAHSHGTACWVGEERPPELSKKVFTLPFQGSAGLRFAFDSHREWKEQKEKRLRSISTNIFILPSVIFGFLLWKDLVSMVIPGVPLIDLRLDLLAHKGPLLGMAILTSWMIYEWIKADIKKIFKFSFSIEKFTFFIDVSPLFKNLPFVPFFTVIGFGWLIYIVHEPILIPLFYYSLLAIMALVVLLIFLISKVIYFVPKNVFPVFTSAVGVMLMICFSQDIRAELLKKPHGGIHQIEKKSPPPTNFKSKAQFQAEQLQNNLGSVDSYELGQLGKDGIAYTSVVPNKNILLPVKGGMLSLVETSYKLLSSGRQMLIVVGSIEEKKIIEEWLHLQTEKKNVQVVLENEVPLFKGQQLNVDGVVMVRDRYIQASEQPHWLAIKPPEVTLFSSSNNLELILKQLGLSWFSFVNNVMGVVFIPAKVGDMIRHARITLKNA